jgi:hypothetical protein
MVNAGLEKVMVVGLALRIQNFCDCHFFIHLCLLLGGPFLYITCMKLESTF